MRGRDEALRSAQQQRSSMALQDPGDIHLDYAKIEPNGCALEAELNMELEFTAGRELPDAFWEVKVSSRVFCHAGRTLMCAAVAATAAAARSTSPTRRASEKSSVSTHSLYSCLLRLLC